jgi:hypothetical protein
LSNDRNCFKKWHSEEGEDVWKCAESACKKRKLWILMCFRCIAFSLLHVPL